MECNGSKQTKGLNRNREIPATATATSAVDEDKVKVPNCGACSKSVSYSHKALQCDACKYWHHITCEKVKTSMNSYRSMRVNPVCSGFVSDVKVYIVT